MKNIHYYVWRPLGGEILAEQFILFGIRKLRSKSVKQLPWKSVEETKSREFLVCSPVLRPLKDVYVFRVWRRMRVLVACLAENDKMGS